MTGSIVLPPSLTAFYPPSNESKSEIRSPSTVVMSQLANKNAKSLQAMTNTTLFLYYCLLLYLIRISSKQVIESNQANDWQLLIYGMTRMLHGDNAFNYVVETRTQNMKKQSDECCNVSMEAKKITLKQYL